MKETTIVCRCEDVTLEEVRERIARGEYNLEEIKRACRCGMGPCQGRSCTPLIAKEISLATGIPVSEIGLPTFRPLVAPIKLGTLAGGAKHD